MLFILFAVLVVNIDTTLGKIKPSSLGLARQDLPRHSLEQSPIGWHRRAIHPAEKSLQILVVEQITKLGKNTLEPDFALKTDAYNAEVGLIRLARTLL